MSSILVGTTKSILTNYRQTWEKIQNQLETNEALRYENCQLSQKLVEIHTLVEVIVSFADQFNAGQINGYWALVRYVDLLMDQMKQLFENGYQRSDEEEMVTICDGCVVMLNHALLTKRAADLEELDSGRGHHCPAELLFVVDTKLTSEALWDALHLKAPVINLLTNFGLFWYHTGVKRLLETYQMFAGLLGTKFPSNFKCLWDKRFRVERFLECIQNPTITHPFRLWEIPDSWMYRHTLLNFFTRGCETISQTISVPRQSRWTLSHNSGSVLQNKPDGSISQRKPIRCRLIQKQFSSNPSSTLVLHCHGGAFLVHTPDCHEEYLRPFVSDMDGVPVLSVDYSIRVPYPVALQEVLDVYYWLISGSDEVKKALGFKPQRLVFCGDSAGAQLMMALNHVIHDIADKCPVFSNRLIVPKSIVAFYPSFQVNSFISPSRILGAVDPILCPSFLLFIIGLYSGIYKQFAGCYDYDSGCNSGESNWYNCSKEEFAKRLKWVTEFSGSNRYLSTCAYPNFEKFKNIRLYVVTSIGCPVLDDSVLMVNKWTGPVEFDVVDKLPHGFLHFIEISQPAKEAMKLCGQRLKEAVNLAVSSE